MSAQRSIILTAALFALLGPVRAEAEATCKPRIELANAQLSNVINLRRYWTATVNVDASMCSASTGLYAIRFVRLAEGAVDLEFTEPFIWKQGQAAVRVEFWADEAVERYAIADVAACPCKGE